jgi:hypothetical protein
MYTLYGAGWEGNFLSPTTQAQEYDPPYEPLVCESMPDPLLPSIRSDRKEVWCIYSTLLLRP